MFCLQIGNLGRASWKQQEDARLQLGTWFGLWEWNFHTDFFTGFLGFLMAWWLNLKNKHSKRIRQKKNYILWFGMKNHPASLLLLSQIWRQNMKPLLVRAVISEDKLFLNFAIPYKSYKCYSTTLIGEIWWLISLDKEALFDMSSVWQLLELFDNGIISVLVKYPSMWRQTFTEFPIVLLSKMTENITIFHQQLNQNCQQS